MTENIQNHRDYFKAVAVKTQGTPTQKLLAIFAELGITDTAELAEITGLKPRAIQAAKRTTMRATECGAVHCAQYNAPNAQQVAPEAQHNAPSKKVSPTPPSKNNIPTLELPQSEITERATPDAFIGRFVKLDAQQIAQLPKLFPRLSFPGDLMAADGWLWEKTKGDISFSPIEDRICRLHTYLAKRNRETPPAKSAAQANTALKARTVSEALAAKYAQAGAL